MTRRSPRREHLTQAFKARPRHFPHPVYLQLPSLGELKIIQALNVSHMLKRRMRLGSTSAALSIHQPLKYGRWARPSAPHARRDSGYPPSCSPSRQLASAQPQENLSICLVCVFCSYILSHGVLTKINLSLVLKGICIYKFGERILTWDLGDWEWPWLSRRRAEWFLENWRIFVDCKFLIEKIIKLDVVHRSKLC